MFVVQMLRHVATLEAAEAIMRWPDVILHASVAAADTGMQPWWQELRTSSTAPQGRLYTCVDEAVHAPPQWAFYHAISCA